MYDAQTGAWIGAEQNVKTPLYRHVAKTYLWMFIALAITFATSYGLYATGAVLALFVTPWMPLALLIGKLVLVVVLTARLQKMSLTAARITFIAYAVTTGIVFSTLFLMYDVTATIFVFGVTSLYFGVMAAVGLITKRDLSGFGPMIGMGLIALIIMGLVSMFFNFYMLDTVVCFVGLILFLGITTYDSKKVKDYYYSFQGDPAMLDKISIYSALNLYLDFINIFLYLLRLLGKRK